MLGHCKKCGSDKIILPIEGVDTMLVICRDCGATLGNLADWKAYLADQAFSPEVRAREALKLARKKKRP